MTTPREYLCMEFRKFILTNLDAKGFNVYIGEMLETLIKDVCCDSIGEEEALNNLLSTDHMMLDQYVDIPRGIEGDHFIREVVEQIETFFMEFTKSEMFYYEELKRRYDENHRLNIAPVKGGLWITI